MGFRVDFQLRKHDILPPHTPKVSILLREAVLGSMASGLHGPDTPAGSTVMSGRSIVLGSKMVGKVTEYGERELLDGTVFVR